MTWKELQDEPTADLIDYIKSKEQPDYTELAEAAFIAFTFRFRKEIIDKCRKIGKNRGYDASTADTIADRVFERFWKYPLGFKKNNCGKLTIDNCILFYLFRIATNCFFDYGAELSGENQSPYDGSEEIVVRFPAIQNSDFKKIYDIIEEALSKLSPKHRTIYLTYKTYEKEGHKLPRALLKKLREDLGLSQNSIRVYKNEAFNIVDDYLKSYGKK